MADIIAEAAPTDVIRFRTAAISKEDRIVVCADFVRKPMAVASRPKPEEEAASSINAAN